MDFLDGVVFCHTYLYTILILYVVMSMIQCMFDVWLCHAFCALCNLTLMLCIWECALAHKALLFSAPCASRLFVLFCSYTSCTYVVVQFGLLCVSILVH